MKKYIRSVTIDSSDSEDFIVRRTPEQEEAYYKWLDYKLLYPISKYVSKDEQKRRKAERERLHNEYLATLKRK